MPGALLLTPPTTPESTRQAETIPVASAESLEKAPLPEEKSRIAARLSTRIFSAMHSGVWGVGSDFKSVVETLLSSPQGLRREIVWCYKEHYERDMIKDCRREFSSEEAVIIGALIRGSDITAAAALIKYATSKIITNREIVFNVLSQFDKDNLQKVSDCFDRMYGRSLKNHLSEKFSGWELRVLYSILNGDKLGALVNRCHAAIHKFMPDSEELLGVVLSLSDSEKQQVAAQYLALYKRDLTNDAEHQLPKLWAEAFKHALQGHEVAAQTLKLQRNVRLVFGSAEKIAECFIGRSNEERERLLQGYHDQTGTKLLKDLESVLPRFEFDLVSCAVTKGVVGDIEKLTYLFQSGWAKFSELIEIFHRYSRDEMRGVRSGYRAHTGRSLQDEINDHFGGRDLVRLRLSLYGKPQDHSDENRRLNVERKLEERGLGYLLTMGLSSKGWRLMNSSERLSGVVEIEASLATPKQQSDVYLGRNLEYVRADLDELQGAKDIVVNRAASIAASTIGAAALIGGLSIPALVATAALAAGVGYLGTKVILRGSLYNKENTERDFAIGAIEGAVSAVAVGTGQYLHSALGKAGKSSAQELLKTGIGNTISGGLATAAEGGVTTSFQGAAFGLIKNLISRGTWQGGVVAGLKKVGISFVTDGASGSVGKMGAMLARYRPKSPLSMS